MSVSDNAKASGGVPLWIIVGVAMLAGGVGSAAVLSANQFLSEVKKETASPIAVATMLSGPDRLLPRGPVVVAEAADAPMQVAELAPANPRFGDTRAIEIKDVFRKVDKSAPAVEDVEESVTLAALAEKPAKPTKAIKAAEDKPAAKPAKSKGPVTGRSVTNDDVNIRAAASSKSRVIGVVPANTSVDIVKCDSWCEISYGGTRGYVYSGFFGKGGKAKNIGQAIAKAQPSNGEVKSSVTLEPKRKWSLFKRKTDDAPAAAENDVLPALN
ncbi:MAG: SH3 domain-containing protein [Phyllobacteriaceae bacterium]|nr:SH3 domain-containing protein [Phyllobacteriaceae bacterium]